MFVRYNKIKRLGDEENQGILNGRVVVHEKLDGANASFYYNVSNNTFVFCSRSGPKGEIKIGPDGNHYLDKNAATFRGLGTWLVDALNNSKTLVKNLITNNHQYFGEWLVKHVIKYNEDAYSKFYLYDVYDHDLKKNVVNPEAIPEFAEMNGIPSISVLGTYFNPTLDDLEKHVGESTLAILKGEGIVIKNCDYINKFGRHAYGKIVCEKFKEVSQQKIIGTGDIYKDISNKFITEARVKKLVVWMNHAKRENPSIEWLGELLGRHWKDLWDEEVHSIIKLVRNNDFKFIEFKKVHNLKIKEIYNEMLDKNIS